LLRLLGLLLLGPAGPSKTEHTCICTTDAATIRGLLLLLLLRRRRWLLLLLL